MAAFRGHRRKKQLLIKLLATTALLWALWLALRSSGTSSHDAARESPQYEAHAEKQQQQKVANQAEAAITVGLKEAAAGNDISSASKVVQNNKGEARDSNNNNNNNNDNNINSNIINNQNKHNNRNNDNDPDNGVIAAPHNPEGPGEMGRPVVVENPDPATKQKIEEGFQLNAFNQYVSDMISVHRSLPDFRRVKFSLTGARWQPALDKATYFETRPTPNREMQQSSL
jgi:hypothetical protein